ncbi:SpoIIE family protein phosphatase [Streptomyces sp. NPDC058653]|uniref:SpoIIE family protein phosphatase n=1 Tax=Streptomyces sp. NPDC058653 TaxID=3346576 RepID=UPI003648D24E
MERVRQVDAYGNESDHQAEDAATRLDRLLVHVAHAANAHIGVIYLLVPERHVLQMNAEIGAPTRLAASWARVAMAASAPLTEAVRSQSPVWLSDQQEMARRFPRLALAFPYSVAIRIVPLVADGECFGALMLMWPGSRPGGLLAAERAEIDKTADRMTEVLDNAATEGRPVRPRDEPLVIEPSRPPVDHPAATLVERFTEGFIALDPDGRMIFLTDRAAQQLGRDRAGLLGAELWDALPWLDDPAYENAFVAAVFSRQPTRFSARRPDGAGLSFHLYPDASGISVRVESAEALDSEQRPVATSLARAPARAGSLLQVLHLTSALTEAAGVHEVTESLMGQVQPALDADALALLVDDEGRQRVVGARGFPSPMTEHFNNLPTATPTEGTRTMETGLPRFHSSNAELLRTYPLHRPYGEMAAFAYLPLTVSGNTFGYLLLGYSRPRTFPPDERAELTSLAGVIAQALERARLYDANAQVARGLQDGLLPRHLSRVPGLEVAARYRPATHALDVGGDFYDLIDFGDRKAAVVIGDVQGHSVQAAALMGQIRTAVHSHASTGAPPEEVLARTNQLLLELDSDLFCSCLYAYIDVGAHRVLLASAGHPPPILRQPSHRTEVLDLPPGLLLGVEETPDFQSVEIPLPPGALLALYTDGLVEQPGVDLGLATDLLAGQLAAGGNEPVDLLADAIIERAHRTTAAQQVSDDIALLLVACDTVNGTHRMPGHAEKSGPGH